MKKSSAATLLGLALVVAACGGAESPDVAATQSGDGQLGTERSTNDDGAVDGQPAEMTFEIADADDDVESDPSPVADGGDSAGADKDGADTAGQTDRVGARLGTLRSVLLDRALDSSDQISSARFEGTMTMVGAPGSELPGELSIVFSGAYDLANNASEVSVDLSGIVAAAAAADPEAAAGMELFAGFFQEPMQVVTIGDRSWMKWGLISLLTGAGDKWLEGEADQSGDMTSQFGFGGNGSPTAMLDLLADADAEVVELGVEDVRGVRTTHYRATVDTAALAADLPADERADLAAELGAGSIAELPMEFWVDDDGLLHRYVLDISEAVLEQEGDAEFTGATFTFEMWDHGADLGIAPPPADQVLTEDEIDFDFGEFADIAG